MKQQDHICISTTKNMILFFNASCIIGCEIAGQKHKIGLAKTTSNVFITNFKHVNGFVIYLNY